jgi:hypothetical protein
MSDIIFTQGDKVTLRIQLKVNGEAINLTGATLTTKFLKTDGTEHTVTDDDHTIDPDQVTNKGWFDVTINAADTANFMTGVKLSFITKYVLDTDVKHFHGRKILTVYDDALSE